MARLVLKHSWRMFMPTPKKRRSRLALTSAVVKRGMKIWNRFPWPVKCCVALWIYAPPGAELPNWLFHPAATVMLQPRKRARKRLRCLVERSKATSRALPIRDRSLLLSWRFLARVSWPQSWFVWSIALTRLSLPLLEHPLCDLEFRRQSPDHSKSSQIFWPKQIDISLNNLRREGTSVDTGNLVALRLCSGDLEVPKSQPRFLILPCFGLVPNLTTVLAATNGS